MAAETTRGKAAAVAGAAFAVMPARLAIEQNAREEGGDDEASEVHGGGRVKGGGDQFRPRATSAGVNRGSVGFAQISARPKSPPGSGARPAVARVAVM